MAKHPATAAPAVAAARVVAAACLIAAAVAHLLAFLSLSRHRAAGGSDLDASSSSSFPKDAALRGDVLLLTPHGHGGCDGLGYEERCGRHRRRDCLPRGGFVDYLYLFYCVLGGGGEGAGRRALACAAMVAWLALLFYLLGDTAARYFCPSLGALARLLGLPPAVAGATLLSLGNGAPDALSAVAAFAAGERDGERRTTTAGVGLGGVLGGALFVSSAVLAVVALRLGGRGGVAVDRASFFRDAAFLLLALAAAAVVLAAGAVTVWGALAFVSLYLVYVLAVVLTPDHHWSERHNAVGEEEGHADTAAADSSELHNVAETDFYADVREPLLPDSAPLLQHYAGAGAGAGKRIKDAFFAALRVLELLLRLPRQLTIPDTSKERWSKPAAVAAAALAPIFLACLWSRHAASGSPSLAAPLVGCLSGVALGLAAFLTTDAAAPPARFLEAWLGGGFVMSAAWSYAIATEILALLISAGTVLSVDAAALGATVLAWGNSVGDLVANVAVASRGGGAGAQAAVAGCYGGPVFNVLVGLGLSMLLASWAAHPQPVAVPVEPGLYRTLGFVVAVLLWAAAVLPRRGMRVDRTLGLGLLAIYFCFLCIYISELKTQ